MVLFVLAVSVVLVAYNLVTNVRPCRESTYLVRNVATGVGLVVAARWAGLTWEDLGLGTADLDDGGAWGGLVVLGTAVVAVLAWAVRSRSASLQRVLVDQRADQPAGRLVFEVLVRIPLGTATFEEVAFRGVLLAACAEVMPTGWAVVAQALVFGLWHVGPTRLALQLNGRWDPVVARRDLTAAVLVTAVGGVWFALLRLGSGSLLAPILSHASINAFGLLLAASAVRSRHVEVLDQA